MSRLDYLFTNEFPSTRYGKSAKSRRLEDISNSFHADSDCDCDIDLDTCRALVNRYSAIMNKDTFKLPALVTYIEKQFGVKVKGSIDELRRVALLGPLE